jgi:hypothetical protein
VSARALQAALMVAVVAAAPGVAIRSREAAQPSIEVLEARRTGQSVVVSYRIADLLPADVLERIHSGIPLRFRHRVELLEKRPGLFAGDRVHARATLEARVAYDSLTQRYELTRSIAMRPPTGGSSGEPEPVEQRQVVDSEQEMQRFLSEVRELGLFDALAAPEGSARLTLRIEVVLGRRWILLVIPTTETVTTELELGS